MQWLLQEFEDTHKLATALDGLGIAYSWHKVVPFVGDLIPEPVVHDPDAVIMFGSYTLWRYAEAKGYRPGVFKLRPFVYEKAWHRYLLNGPDALFLKLGDVPHALEDDGKDWFLRPVDDSKEAPGRVRRSDEIVHIAKTVLALDEDEIPRGSLRHDTLLMLTEPVRIQREWRLWVVNDAIVTHSLYKDGSRVVYRREIDDEALAFGKRLVGANPGYAPAYVIDICGSERGLRMLETNCINAAGFYAADLEKLASAIDTYAAD
ncbi:MAG: ATP-grasp domain-containing protein [Pseudomonadota bacterium]